MVPTISNENRDLRARRHFGWRCSLMPMIVGLLPYVGQAQNVEWAHSAGGVHGDDGSAIAVDAAGNSYVTGSFRNEATFGSITITGFFDAFVVKYDASGNVLWVRSVASPVNVDGFRIAVDEIGNCYVTGRFTDTATFGSFTISSSGSVDVFVVKYDANGNVLWTRSDGGTAYDMGLGIAVDTAGNSYVTGEFQDTASFGPFTLTSAGSTDVFVVKYDADGNILWARSNGGIIGSIGVQGIAVDTFGRSLITGDFQGAVTYGPFTLSSAGGRDIYLAKYDTNGNVLWASSAGGTSEDGGIGVAVDTASNCYVTGGFRGTASFGPFTVTSAGFGDVFVAKYDIFGNTEWVTSAGGQGQDSTFGISNDPAGNTYVTGRFERTATFGELTLTSAGMGDVFVAEYDTGGNVLWIRSAKGMFGDAGRGVGLDAFGNIYVTGVFGFGPFPGGGTLEFSPLTITSAGGGDIFVVKYDDCGNGIIEAAEQCEGGLGCTDCLCNGGFEPTTPPSADCQPICGNGNLDPGEECDEGVGNGAVGCIIPDCTCRGDCTIATEIVPAISEWGLVVMILLGLVAGTLMFGRMQDLAAAGVNPNGSRVKVVS